MNNEYFSTEDFGFSTFLKAEGVDLLEVAISNPDTNKCKFIFKLKKDSKLLKKLNDDWHYSNRVKRDKELLYASKILKKALKDFLTEYTKNNDSNVWEG